MDPFSENNLISTKEASEQSGYHSDYLSRLCREGKLEAKQVGRMWFVSRASLEGFVEEQTERKREFAESLAREREREYKSALTATPSAPVVVTFASLSTQFFSNRAFATSPLAALVITFGIFGSALAVSQAGVVTLAFLIVEFSKKISPRRNLRLADLNSILIVSSVERYGSF